jgi:hypothetical protein
LSTYLEFLTRNGCHLCEDALPVARRAARRARTELVVTEIEAHDSLVAEFGLRIPVLRWSDGTVVAEGIIEEKTVLKAVRQR